MPNLAQLPSQSKCPVNKAIVCIVTRLFLIIEHPTNPDKPKGKVDLDVRLRPTKVNAQTYVVKAVAIEVGYEFLAHLPSLPWCPGSIPEHDPFIGQRVYLPKISVGQAYSPEQAWTFTYPTGTIDCVLRLVPTPTLPLPMNVLDASTGSLDKLIQVPL